MAKIRSTQTSSARKKRSDIAHAALALHKKLGGKLAVSAKAPIRTARDLSLLYTPGVGAVSSRIAAHKKEARELTMKGRMVAVVSDGSAVLGLGNLGPEAALPVMEGKAVLFKEFGGVEAFPIVLDAHEPEDIIAAVKAIAPGFGGINLEDIKAPECFIVEERLKKELSIPVMHDDQHGTAIVVLAGLTNALTVVKKELKRARIAVIGAGAAGTAIAKLLILAGAGDVIVTDSKGILALSRDDLNSHKRTLAGMTNSERRTGDSLEAARGADALIGVSGPGSISAAHVRAMAERPVVFALANPIPEIMPDVAQKAGAAVIATGRSDFPNQINNVLVFPGVFRGALDNRVTQITDDMKLRAARALAALVARPTAEKIIPSVFDKRVAKAVAKAVT